MTGYVITLCSAMATRVQRNTTNIASIGFQAALDEGNTIKMEHILTMLHPHHEGFPLNYSGFKKYIAEKLFTKDVNIKCVYVRDAVNQRNILVADETDYDIMCNTERKEHHRMPVFTILVTMPQSKRPGPPVPPSPVINIEDVKP
jgi:hypothetical protein